MAIKHIIWRPDVCNCVVDFTFDDATGWEGGVTVLNSSEICPEHAGVGNIHTTVWNECKQKEKVRDIAKKSVFGSKLLTENGEYTTPWKFKGMGDSRVFELETEGKLSTGEKTALKNASDVALGAGRVDIK